MKSGTRAGGCRQAAVTCALVLWTMSWCDVTRAADAAIPDDLAELSLDELLGIEVTSVSKRAERLTESAAAIYVLTGDDLRRSGDRTIAEALRRVPGLQVARVGQGYAISARGFNSTSADKLQVLLDGRSVYTPLFSGVFWDVLDTYMPDIERIEVIRGPGATLWGANAVNGVINIVTRDARDTTGLDATVRGGTRGNASGGARLGMVVQDLGHVRMYAQARADDNGVLADGSEGIEGLRMQQAGFRADLAIAPGHALTISGDGYSGETAAARVDRSATETDLRGGDLSARWEHQQSSRAHVAAELYWDHSRRKVPTVFDEERDTFDFQLEEHVKLGDIQDVVLGLGYRRSRDETGEAPFALIFDPPSRTLETWSGFVQDQIALGSSATVTLGSKFEDNDFTGFEAQPGARFGLKLGDDGFTWAAVSRAVRTPNRLDSDVAIFCPPPVGLPGTCGPGEVFRIGNRDLDAEELLAVEWGLRAWSAHGLSAELALFYNRYRNLRSQESAPPFGRFDNALHGDGIGGELNLTWQPRSTLQVRGFYGYLRLDVDRDDGGTDTTSPRTIEGGSPRHSAGLSLDWTPTAKWSVNAFARHVDDLPAFDVPAYTELNLTVLRRVTRELEIGLIGENLLDDRHPEFGASTATRLEVQRQVLVQLRWTPR
ncbi:MAG TPA: TonB-dependent receptor [Nevskiaceae bacterium]|nr:TonB-dependent receptor [Nevskiaceae bacterium]